MSIVSTAKHYHNRSFITGLAKRLQLKNINYDEGLELLNRYYFGSSYLKHFSEKEHRQKIFDETIQLKYYENGLNKELLTRPTIKRILEEDLSDIVLSDLIDLVFPPYILLGGTTYHKQLDRDKWISDFSGPNWFSHTFFGLSHLAYYSNWVETEGFLGETGVINYLKLPNALKASKNPKDFK
jgi:hypothetical protein